KDYESLLWKLAHEKVSIYVYRKQWYIMIHTRCNFLTSDNKCGIYEDRPYLCKEHSVENCEYTGDDYGFSDHFKSYDDLLEHIKENTNFRFKLDPTGVRPNCV
ncbi:MAG TPA: YkgJ family cysteine cluster protein, partial [Planctomycetes bacterium]|nr:YkgJ family cysteine cluster protein [Planctomycetota bacterium]